MSRGAGLHGVPDRLHSANHVVVWGLTRGEIARVRAALGRDQATIHDASSQQDLYRKVSTELRDVDLVVIGTDKVPTEILGARVRSVRPFVPLVAFFTRESFDANRLAGLSIAGF